jgi:vancomycin resistance protein YoaR
MILARIWRTILVLITVFVFVFLLALVIYLFLGSRYSQKIFPGIRLGNINLQGKTASEAKELIYTHIDTINQDGLVFEYGDKAAIIYPLKSYSPDGDVIETLIDFDVDKTIDNAMAIGRSNKFVPDLLNRFSLLVGRRVELIANLDRDKIINRLNQGFAGIVPVDAKFYMAQNDVAITPDSDGKLLTYNDGLDKLDKDLKRFDFSTIVLNDNGDGKANILADDCVKVQDQAKAIAALAPVKLRYKGKSIGTLDANTLIDWIHVSKSSGADSKISLSLDKDKINKYLDEYVEIQIDEEPVLPKFTFKNGMLQKIRSAKSGLELDMSLAADMLVSLPQNNFKSLDLSVRKMPIADLKADTNFGIKEKIGGSSSEIIESSDNRIKNIKNGVSAVNGLLIAPNDEFSLLSALSPFNEANGYVKEIVIGSNGFTPDFGGGLCQLSTTVFRAALDSGLPITMRRNHSYWLHYYSPPGTDATIFEPTPDLRFVNDTGKYILLQANVDDKLNLNIEFWGTKDGRIATRTEPVVYNIVSPGAAKTIKTANLAPGVTKCQYDSYKGADAYFYYKVIYPSGEVKEQRFNSHYIPKPMTCYVGI